MDITATVVFCNSYDLGRAINYEFLCPTGLLNFFLQWYSKKMHAVDDSFLTIHRTMNSGIVSALYLGVSKAITVLCYWAYSRNNFVLKLVSEAKGTVIIWHL